MLDALLAPAVELRNLHVLRGERWVLNDLSTSIGTGEVTAIIGANGSGKSTLLEVLAGLRTPTRGVVRHGDPAAASGRAPVAYVPQHMPGSATLPLTVRDVVTMGRWADRGPWRPLRRSDRALVDRWIEQLELTSLAKRRLDTLSGGQRQRALVARALVQDAPVLVLDEPTTGLDTDSRDQFLLALRQATGEGTTVVASTHDTQLAAAADRVLALRDGVAVTTETWSDSPSMI